MLSFKKGNLLNSQYYALINTVNTVGIMGKGIALQFKNEFPYNYKRYRQACLLRQLFIGKLLPVTDTSLFLGERLIINFPTKTHWRLPSQYDYIEQGLLALTDIIKKEDIKSVALPALGCGNGNLDWPVVKRMIVSHLEPMEALIEIYEPSH